VIASDPGAMAGVPSPLEQARGQVWQPPGAAAVIPTLDDVYELLVEGHLTTTGADSED
jgi:hypothetical protein